MQRQTQSPAIPTRRIPAPTINAKQIPGSIYKPTTTVRPPAVKATPRTGPIPSISGNVRPTNPKPSYTDSSKVYLLQKRLSTPPTENLPVKRFKDSTQKQLDELAMASKSKKTHSQTRWGVTALKDWLRENNHPLDFEALKPDCLALLLTKFYGDLMNKEGKEYSKSALQGIRACIQRHLALPPFNVKFNIITGDTFKGANNVLAGRIKEMQRQGLDTSTSHPPISCYDLMAFYDSGALSNYNPTSLQNKVFFELSMHFGRRGREGLRELNKGDIIFLLDSEHREYATLGFNPYEKNYQGLDPKDRSHDQRMYAVDDPRDPVTSLKLYLSKLHPDCDALFQRAKVKNYYQSSTWYCNSPLGKNTLGKMMEKICEMSFVKTKYTNHSIRATTVTTLRNAGIQIQDIMSVTGHKNASSINMYSKTSDSSRFGMSQVLTQNLPSIPSATVSIPPEEDNLSSKKDPSNRGICNVPQTQKNYSKIIQDFLGEDLPTIQKPKKPTPKVTLLNFSPEKSPIGEKSSNLYDYVHDTSHIDLTPNKSSPSNVCLPEQDFKLFDLSWDSIPPYYPDFSDFSKTHVKEENVSNPCTNLSKTGIMENMHDPSLLSNNMFKDCVFNINISK